MSQLAEEKIKVEIPKEFRELFNPYWRIFAVYGGRGGLKSHTIARALLLRGRESQKRILCTREIQRTIGDSVHKLLKDIINLYEFTDYVVTDKSIRNTVTSTEFLFAGLRHNTTEIKSMEGIDICWVEEAHSITDASLDILTPTIRKEGSQIIFSYNRLTELDPVHVKYVIKEYPKTCVINVNYDVAERLGWLPDVLKLELEADREHPSLFAHKWLGEPISQSENSIVSRDNALLAMQRKIEGDGQIEIGVDVARMGSDRTVFWGRKGLKTIGKKVYQHLRTTEICDQLERFVEKLVIRDENEEQNHYEARLRTIPLKIDDTGVGGGVTDEMMKRGYNVIAINFGAKAKDDNKYPNLISEAWFEFDTNLPGMELPMDTDLLMELTTRQWAQDSKGKRRVESKVDYKKRGYKSPDLADACIICYYTPRSSQVRVFANKPSGF